MASDVDIANMALAQLGTRSTIASLNEKSTEAKKINLFFETARKAVFEEHDWQFASTTVDLSLTGSPPQDWVYQYAYPNNCVEVREVLRQARDLDPIPFRVAYSDASDSLVILTDEEAAQVRYTRLVKNPVLYPATFIDAFAAKLAAEVAMSLTGKRSLRDDAISLYKLLLAKAAAFDAGQKQPDAQRDAAWHESR